MQLLSWYPRAYLLPNLIDERRAAHIVALAQRRLRPSTLALKRGETEESTQWVHQRAAAGQTPLGMLCLSRCGGACCSGSNVG